MNHRRLRTPFEYILSFFLFLLLLLGFLDEVGITRVLRRAELQFGQTPSIAAL